VIAYSEGLLFLQFRSILYVLLVINKVVADLGFLSMLDQSRLPGLHFTVGLMTICLAFIDDFVLDYCTYYFADD